MDEERSRTRSHRVYDAGTPEGCVTTGMEAYLLSTARGAPEEEAFAAALSRSMERYLDSLDPEARLRLRVGLHPPGRPIPEERLLSDDPEELAATSGAAKRLAEAGEIRRVRDAATGRVYWLRPDHPRTSKDRP